MQRSCQAAGQAESEAGGQAAGEVTGEIAGLTLKRNDDTRAAGDQADLTDSIDVGGSRKWNETCSFQLAAGVRPLQGSCGGSEVRFHFAAVSVSGRPNVTPH